ncbi:MAG: phosphatase PAP2 family protein [Thermomicrobiales bacterium]
MDSETAIPPVTKRRRVRLSNRRLLASGASLAFFAAIAAVVHRNPNLSADVTATLRLQRRQHPFLTRFMSAISWLGFRPQSLLLPGTLVAGYWAAGHRRSARFLVFAWAASFVSYTTKRLVMRPRPNGPDVQVVEADLRDSSFPSGHVLHYVVFWGFVCYLWNSTIKNPQLRRIPMAVVGFMIATVGISRVYLGHHWLTDVIGSYSLGSAILLSLIGFHTRPPMDEGSA